MPTPERGMPTFPAPDQPPRPAAFTLPALAAQEYVTAPKDLATVDRILQEQQDETQRRLEKSLRMLYDRLARRFELTELDGLSEREQRRFKEMNETIRAIFEQYAADRMPRVLRLAFLVGFPDPNPQSVPPKEPMGTVSQAKFDEAKSLRAAISELDRNFNATVLALAATIESDNTADRTDTRLKIELNADELRQRAVNEAAQQIIRARRSLSLELAGSQRIRLPAVPGRTVNPPVIAAPMPPPKVDSRLEIEADRWARREVEGQLRIWAALNRYELGNGGRDATNEFIQWKKTHQSGP
jgi:hypothetical protein